MSEFTPHFAPIVVLLFLGTALLLSVSFLVLFYGAALRSSFCARLGFGAGVVQGSRSSRLVCHAQIPSNSAVDR